jgi:DNA-directed RNA polymerase subunit RPC12/RpoP
MEVVQYKCPNCSADLEFKSESQNFGCKFCDSFFSSEQLAEIYPQKERHALDKTEPVKTDEEHKQEAAFAEYNALYSCPSCGAAVITETNTSATRCFYCYSPVILTGRLSGEYRPSKVIPFKVSKSEAEEKMREFCKKRWFLPSGFRSETKLSDITAIYIPYWIADCKTAGRITANCKKLRVWSSGNYKYTETKEYIAVRDGEMRFGGIPHDASAKADDTMMECIEPYNYKDAEDFKMSYLSGYLAEKYDVTKEQVYPRVKERAVNGAVNVMRQTITGYNSVTVTGNTIDIVDNKWDHFLMPVWFLTYNYKDKQYHFAVNGQTGKFTGNLPVVWGKVAVAIGAVAVVVDAVIALIMTVAGG